MDDKLAEIERLKKFTEADSVRITEKYGSIYYLLTRI